MCVCVLKKCTLSSVYVNLLVLCFYYSTEIHVMKKDQIKKNAFVVR